MPGGGNGRAALGAGAGRAAAGVRVRRDSERIHLRRCGSRNRWCGPGGWRYRADAARVTARVAARVTGGQSASATGRGADVEVGPVPEPGTEQRFRSAQQGDPRAPGGWEHWLHHSREASKPTSDVPPDGRGTGCRRRTVRRRRPPAPERNEGVTGTRSSASNPTSTSSCRLSRPSSAEPPTPGFPETAVCESRGRHKPDIVEAGESL